MENQVEGKIAFTEENERTFQDILKRYPTKEAALLPTLWLATGQFGYLPERVLEYVSSRLDVSPVRVFSVAEFYTMLHRTSTGRYHIQLCRNLSCTLRGSERLADVLTEKLRIGPGEKTEDGTFSLEFVECLGSCGTAPVIRINDTYYENLTVERLERILEACRQGRDASSLEG